LRSGIKVVLFFVIASALLGFTQFPIAEGAVSWNGFLREIGFNPTSVYEVSGVSIISSGTGNEGNIVQLRCLDGDWFNVGNDDQPPKSIAMSTDEPSLDLTGIDIVAFGQIIYESAPGIVEDYRKPIGWDGFPRRNQVFGSDISVTMTILCHSPSSLMTVGGEWIATDTTALIIGYSVLNAYWIAPTAVGIGLGLYLVKRKL